MAHKIKLNKQTENIEIDAGEDSIVLNIKTDDDNIERMLTMVGNAMDRFASLQHKIDTEESEEGLQDAKQAMVRLQKRCITAIVGEEGYNDILLLMSDDDEPVDPTNNIVNIGDVFAALTTWLYDHCTAKQLRDAGVYFDKQKVNISKKKRKKK